jgi:hypothetical protein
MRIYPAIAVGLAFAFLLAACTDTPSTQGKGPAGGTGEGGISRLSDDADDQEALPAPTVEKGVVPDVLGVALGDAEDAIEAAGFETDAEGGGAFNVLTASLLICEQDPEGGSSPKKGSGVALQAERSCE